MSYDIAIFDPSAATDAEVPTWFQAQSEWTEDHSYDDLAVTTPELAAFAREMYATYPPMNGPDAPSLDDPVDDDLESRLADYTIGTRLIYIAFAWSHSEAAAALVRDVAAKHGVAVYWASDDGSIDRP